MYDTASGSAPYGFNLMDVSSKSEADATPRGAKGLIWIGNYNNATCKFDVTNAQVKAQLAGTAGDSKIAGYFIADEPNATQCPSAPRQLAARSHLVHHTDTNPSHFTLMVADMNSGRRSFSELPLWKGATDFVGLDPYPCDYNAPCDYSLIDHTISAANSAGLSYWGVVQAFNQPNTWRWPTPSELTHMLHQWAASKQTGYAVFSWTWDGYKLSNHPGLLSALRSFNGTVASGSRATTPDTTPPSVPTRLTATAGNRQVSLAWNASTDPDDAVVGYSLYRNGSKIARATSTRYTDTGVTNRTTYSYQVSAVDSHGNESARSRPVSATPHAPAPPATTPHIMVILEENHSYSQIVRNAKLPYINSLISHYGLATNWWGLSHPSEPNYLGVVSGSIWDNPGDLTPQRETYAGPTVVDQMANAGIGWKAYMEDMPHACDLTDTYSPGYYDVNHNPFMYFRTIRGNSKQCHRDVPYTQFATDLSNNTAPPFIFMTPNLLHDMHDGTYQQGDSWLHSTMGEVLASRWYAQRGVVIITWDEGGSPSDQIATLVVAKNNSGKRLRSFGNHYGMLRAIEEAYRLPLLRRAAGSSVGDLTPLF